MDAVRDPLADRSVGGSLYARHRPEDTLLYRIIHDNHGDFVGRLQAQGRSLPQFVRREFGEHLKCGRLDQAAI